MEEFDHVSRVVCDLGQHEEYGPGFTQTDCSVLLPGGWEDIGRIDESFFVDLSDSPINDIRYVSTEPNQDGGVRLEVDLQGTHECVLTERDEYGGRKLECKEPAPEKYEEFR